MSHDHDTVLLSPDIAHDCWRNACAWRPMCVPPVRVAIEAGRARIVATKSDKPTQPSPEEGARQAAPGGPCVRHNGIAAGRACAAPPVACRDRGGRRQWHVGIAAGAASGMSESRRACAVSFTLRANDRRRRGFPGLRRVACLAAHVCGASRSQQDEHALFCPRVASDGRDRTPQPSVEGSVRSDGRHPRLPAAFGLRGQLPGLRRRP